MGGSPSKSEQKMQKPNEYFLTLTIDPEANRSVAEVAVKSSAQLNKWASDLLKVTENKPNNILVPKQFRVAEQSVCGDFMKIQIEFECYSIQLSSEISKRSQCEKYLEEAQLWYLVYCLVESAVFCHKMGGPIGDVRPENILLNKSGSLKILSKLSIPNFESPFYDYHKKNYLFSPEELDHLRMSYKQNPQNYIASQSFSIGMTALSAGNLIDMSKCYKYASSELDISLFNKYLDFWMDNQFYSEITLTNTKYSKGLKNIVSSLVDLNPNTRMTSLEVFKMLSPYTDSIMKLEPFHLDSSRLSPIRKVEHIFDNTGKSQSIHKLRSRKRSTILNQSKNQLGSQGEKLLSEFVYQTNSKDLNNSFTFNAPNAVSEYKSTVLENSISPKRSKKLNTTALLKLEREHEQTK